MGFFHWLYCRSSLALLGFVDGLACDIRHSLLILLWINYLLCSGWGSFLGAWCAVAVVLVLSKNIVTHLNLL